MRDRQQSILNGTHTESGKVEKTRGLKAILDSSTPTTSTTIAGGKTAASSKVKAVSKVATKRKRTAGVAFASSDAHDLPMELAMLTPPPSSLQPSAGTSSTTTVVSGTASNQGQKVPVGKRGRLTKTAPVATSSSSTSQQHIADTETHATTSSTTASYSTTTTTAATSEVAPGHTLDKDILWAVGWDRFYQEERHRLCLTLVRERMGVIAGDVIKYMLDTSLATEGKRNEPYSCRMSVDDIYYQMNKLASSTTATSSSTSSTAAAAAAGAAAVTASVDRATLSSVLEVMRLDGVRILTKVRLCMYKLTITQCTTMYYHCM